MVEFALGRGANSYCVAMHCRIQRMLAPLAAGVGLQGTHMGLGLTIDHIHRHTHIQQIKV